MLFNSLVFILYLPLVFVGYWFVFRKLRVQNMFMVFASYVFYGWWDWRFLLLLALTTLCSYVSGIAMADAGTCRQRKVFLWSNVVLNLGILALFKYYDFFTANLQALLAPVGVHLDFVTVNLVLPVGISFYTFQALGYSIDVYRRTVVPTRDAAAFFAFISFFPQLVAGPIERAANLLPQFQRKRRFDYAEAVDGCRRILWGAFKKMVVADNCAVIVEQVFGGWQSMGGFNLWIGAIAFALQIYGDFSGYSDIAIGVARLFGIDLMRNFNVPYFSRDLAEFWRRWHISLTMWFRDYVYIPLGGSRCGRVKVLRNTLMVFLISGLWHGGKWTFVAWGGYHALLFMPLILLGRNRKYTSVVAEERKLPTLHDVWLMGVTFLLVVIGWVIFRADTLSDAWGYIYRMFTCFQFTELHRWKKLIPFVLMLFTVEWVERRRLHPFAIAGNGLLRYAAVRYLMHVGLAMVVLLCRGPQGEFIYFQF